MIASPFESSVDDFISAGAILQFETRSPRKVVGDQSSESGGGDVSLHPEGSIGVDVFVCKSVFETRTVRLVLRLNSSRMQDGMVRVRTTVDTADLLVARASRVVFFVGRLQAVEAKAQVTGFRQSVVSCRWPARTSIRDVIVTDADLAVVLPVDFV